MEYKDEEKLIQYEAYIIRDFCKRSAAIFWTHAILNVTNAWVMTLTRFMNSKIQNFT
jgi:hypothetical protein